MSLLEEQTQGLYTIYSFPQDPVTRMIQLKKRFMDHDLDLADISLVVLAEHLGHGTILTFDLNDFSFLRWKNTHTFEINPQHSFI